MTVKRPGNEIGPVKISKEVTEGREDIRVFYPSKENGACTVILRKLGKRSEASVASPGLATISVSRSISNST